MTNFHDFVSLIYPSSNLLEQVEISSILQEIDEIITKCTLQAHSTIATKTLDELQQLYTYPYPKPQESNAVGVTCSKFMNETPFNLATEIYGLSDDDFNNEQLLKKSNQTTRLQILTSIVTQVQQIVGCEWLGIYRTVNNVAFLNHDGSYPVLLKEAYVGEFSRPDFPLTQDFAKISNNSTVGLTGQVKLIDDVYGELTSDSAYYNCDAKVQTELCVPIMHYQHGTWHVIGIVDAEAWKPNWFSETRQLQIIYTCYLLGLNKLFIH